jgi:hypothetical protein
VTVAVFVADEPSPASALMVVPTRKTAVSPAAKLAVVAVNVSVPLKASVNAGPDC